MSRSQKSQAQRIQEEAAKVRSLPRAQYGGLDPELRARLDAARNTPEALERSRVVDLFIEATRQSERLTAHDLNTTILPFDD